MHVEIRKEGLYFAKDRFCHEEAESLVEATQPCSAEQEEDDGMTQTLRSTCVS